LRVRNLSQTYTFKKTEDYVASTILLIRIALKRYRAAYLGDLCVRFMRQGGNRRGAIFFKDGNQQIYCDMLAEQLRKFSVEVWAYCPYTQSCPFDFDAAGSGRHEPDVGRSASPVYQLHQCAWPMDRSLILEPVRVGRHGRVTHEVRGILGKSESGSGPAGASRRAVGVVECAGTPYWQG
jgi:hypothetical protein